MRKLFIVFLLSLSSAYATDQNTMIHFNDNSNVQFQASFSNINRLFVQGDKIIKHVAPEGTFIFDKSLSQDGSLYFKPVYPQKAFTLFFDTAKGHHFSALVIPVNDTGQTIEMIANNISHQASHWEKNASYLSILQKLMLVMIQNKNTAEIQGQSVTDSDFFNGYPKTKMRLIKVYESAKLNGFVYEIINQTNDSIELKERKFWHPSVRAVALKDQCLKPKGSSLIYTIVAKG